MNCTVNQLGNIGSIFSIFNILIYGCDRCANMRNEVPVPFPHWDLFGSTTFNWIIVICTTDHDSDCRPWFQIIYCGALYNIPWSVYEINKLSFKQTVSFETVEIINTVISLLSPWGAYFSQASLRGA